MTGLTRQTAEFASAISAASVPRQCTDGARIGIADCVGVMIAGANEEAPRIVAGVRSTSPELVGPVLAYMAVISTMVVFAFGRGVAVGIVGALLFYASDAILAWNRFVTPSRTLQIAVMVTYHLAQLGLVLSLLG